MYLYSCIYICRYYMILDNLILYNQICILLYNQICILQAIHRNIEIYRDIQIDIDTYRHIDIQTYRYIDIEIQIYRYIDIQIDMQIYVAIHILHVVTSKIQGSPATPDWPSPWQVGNQGISRITNGNCLLVMKIEWKLMEINGH